jgi:Bacterial SH3 domain.
MNKKVKIIALVLAITCLMAIAAPALAAFSTMYVNCPVGQTVRLRATASTSGTTLTNIPRGTAVQAEYYNSSWHKVKYGSYTGYMMSSFLSTTKP